MTSLSRTQYVVVDGAELYVSSANSRSVSVFPIAAAGDVAPTRTFQFPTSVTGLFIQGDELIVSKLTDAAAIHVLNKNTGVVLRTITGASTLLSGPDQCSVYKSEIYCANHLANRVVVFPLSANGDVAPTRVIGGANTGFAGSAGLFID